MTYDLAIIGGGINGTGIARDAALRGLRVALFEREDWGAGTTGASTRMVHGGVRYLLYDIPTTRVSSEDAGRIRRIAVDGHYAASWFSADLPNVAGGPWRVESASVVPNKANRTSEMPSTDRMPTPETGLFEVPTRPAI